ncbi:MAG: hypothetical protein ACR2QJ_01845 [Geminicoccaceae bacterium]
MADTAHSEIANQPDSTSRSGFPALSIDWELYGSYLDDSDLSDADKRACIEALWSMMVSFVDMGFRLAPVPDICEEIPSTKTSDGKDTARPLSKR